MNSKSLSFKEHNPKKQSTKDELTPSDFSAKHAILKTQVREFLARHKIVDALPDNCRLVVVNQDLSLSQLIQAQVVQQQSPYSLIYHSGQREFTGIVTVRNVLELLISLVEQLDQVYQSVNQNDSRSDIVAQFLEQYLRQNIEEEQSKSFLTENSEDDFGVQKRNGRSSTVEQALETFDLSLLGSIMAQISIQEWYQLTNNRVTFKKSKLVKSIDTNATLLDALTKIHEGLNLLTFVSSDNTRVSGCLHTTDLLSFITTNWVQDISCFKI
jgi:hypothetical protein